MVDVDALAAAMLQSVPFAKTLGIEFVEVAPDGARAVCRLPDNPAVHNHVGGPHAGAMFALGETASGAVVMATFADQLGRAVPLAVRAGIEYHKLARGPVLATAMLADPPSAAEDTEAAAVAGGVIAELDAGGRPEFEVRVEITRADGAIVANLVVVWTLRPN
jgi:acyl-coenzyme A thioesterase PaaI-like protein